MKSFFFALSFALLIPALSSAQEIPANTNLPDDVRLVKALSQCVDSDVIAVNEACLKKSFFPLLGLAPKTEILDGTFGRNTYGRFFSFAVRKVSKKGLVGYFDVTVYFSKEVFISTGKDKRLLVAKLAAKNGRLYGTIPETPDHAMSSEFVSIYDLGSGDYLVGNEHRQVVGSLSLEGSKRDLAGFRSLLNEQKKIGQILDERLLAVGDSQTAATYASEALMRKNAFDSMNNPHQLIVRFD